MPASSIHVCSFFIECVCVCVKYIAGSLAAGRWTAWPWRDKRTMAFLCRWTLSSCRPLGSWAGGPVSAPSLTTSSENMERTSCSRLHWEVNKVTRLWFYDIIGEFSTLGQWTQDKCTVHVYTFLWVWVCDRQKNYERPLDISLPTLEKTDSELRDELNKIHCISICGGNPKEKEVMCFKLIE